MLAYARALGLAHRRDRGRRRTGIREAVCLAMELLQRFDAPEAAAAAAELGEAPGRPRAEACPHGREHPRPRRPRGGAAAARVRGDAEVRRSDARGRSSAPMLISTKCAPTPSSKRPQIRARVSSACTRPCVGSSRTGSTSSTVRASSGCTGWPRSIALRGSAEYEEEEDVDPGSLSYGSWYRYEDSGWQAAKRQWLYHQTRASSSGKGERELGRLRFTRVFLDAFWWWGCYLDFPFCQTLLDDWRTRRADSDWTVAFTQLLDSYPHGYKKAKESDDWREGELPRWDAVRAALLELREACGLAGDPRAFEETGAAAHAGADRQLPRARLSLRVDGRSCVPRRRSRTTTRQSSCSKSTTMTGTRRGRASSGASSISSTGAWTRHAWIGNASAELVPELGGRGAGGEPPSARGRRAHWAQTTLTLHSRRRGRAVLHAYLFQRRPHPPDEYTLTFYTEQVARALERLVEHSSGGDDAAHAAELLAAPFPGRPGLGFRPMSWRSAGEALDLQGLSAALFPDPTGRRRAASQELEVHPALAPRRVRARPGRADGHDSLGLVRLGPEPASRRCSLAGLSRQAEPVCEPRRL